MVKLPDTWFSSIFTLFEIIHAICCFGDCYIDSICLVDDGLNLRIHAWHTGSYSPSRMKKTCPRLIQRAASLSIALILVLGDLTPIVAHPVPSPAEMHLDCETRAADDRKGNESQHHYNARMRGAWRIYDDALETASEILAAEIIAIQTAYLFCTAAPVVCHSLMGVAMIAAAGQYRLAVNSATYTLISIFTMQLRHKKRIELSQRWLDVRWACRTM